MDLDELISQVQELLQRDKRVSYRMLKRRFDLGDDYIEDLKDELIYAKKLATDEDNRVLVWGCDTDLDAKPTAAPSTPEATPSPTTTPEVEPLSYTPQYLTEKILTSRSALEGERKQVTVLFADIKDSTELIRDLDPEDAQKLLDPAIHIMMESVHRFEGTVNQVLGDGIMSIFGAPIAHEDHAARTCYAALAMQSAMQPHAESVLRSHGIAMRIRVGMNSGEVVVQTIGNNLHMDYSAVGSTTHLAARMEQIAAPGSIMMSGAVLRLTEGLVRVKGLGAVPVKGMSEPVEVYERTGASTIRRRLEAAVARGLTQFVGRDTEIEALRRALEQAEAGHGQIVAAVGEAGVGKSRLAYEFIHSHRTQGWRMLESASISYGKASPYFPVIDLLKRYVEVEERDDPRTIRAKVTGHILTLDETLQETIPAVLSLLEALPDDSSFLQLDPPGRRQRTLDGLKRILLRESQVQPLLLVFEDLHWIDSETQSLLDLLVESLPTAKVLLLINYRPEYQHHWGNKTFYTQLRLDPLSLESTNVFLEALLGCDPSLERLKPLLIARTEGNPFFLEESVRTLVETERLVGEPGAYRLVHDLLTIQVPATVQAILAARIDRLDEDEKRLLQTAAVVGIEVSLPLFQAITEMPGEVFHRGLSHLQAAEFLYETSLYPEHVYTFKHALTHEVAYGSLLHERRRVLHGQIVEALEALSEGRLADQIDRLAYHALRGEVWDKALMYFRQAGAKAMEQSAYREAVTCFDQGLEATLYLPQEHEILEQAIDLRLDLRHALFPLGEQERVLEHLQTAESLAEDLNDTYRLGRIAGYLSSLFTMKGELDRAFVSAQRALALTTSHHDVEGQVMANRMLGRLYVNFGDYRQALEVLQQAIDMIEDHRINETSEPGLPSVSSRTLVARCHAELGTFAEGLAVSEEAIQLAEAVDHAWDLADAYAYRGNISLIQGDLASAIALLERSLAICEAAQIRLRFPIVAAPLTVAYALAGRSAEALALIDQVVDQVRSLQVLQNLSEAYLRVARLDDAHKFAVRTLALAQERKQCGVQAHVLRLLGDIAMHRDPPEIDQAKIQYRQAIELAQELGMRPLQAHCHRSLGTLYRQTGQADQAHTELISAIDMYRDMEMMFWLPETEAALGLL